MIFKSAQTPVICPGLLIFLIIMGGCVSGPGNSPVNPGHSEMDAWCEIQEFNLSIMHNRTIIPVTDEEIREYSEFGMYLHNASGNPVSGNSGTRLIGDFECNESRAIRFIALSRKVQEFPDQPVFEHHGHFYALFCNSRGGTTAPPTIAEESHALNYIISCSINEVDRGIIMNSTVLSFSQDLGKIAPELERGMMEAGESPGGWYDKRRYVSTVRLDSDIDEVFCTMRNPSDVCINQTSVYEYHGRYFDFICTVQPLTHPTAGGSSG